MLLAYGSRGAAVVDAQRRLLALGYNVGKSGADGVFGGGTRDAVRKFNADHLARSADALDDAALSTLKTLTANMSLPPAAQPKTAEAPPPESIQNESKLPLGLIAAGAGGLVLLFAFAGEAPRSRRRSS